LFSLIYPASCFFLRGIKLIIQDLTPYLLTQHSIFYHEAHEEKAKNGAHEERNQS
jgi:hypothetical protein